MSIYNKDQQLIIRRLEREVESAAADRFNLRNEVSLLKESARIVEHSLQLALDIKNSYLARAETAENELAACEEHWRKVHGEMAAKLELARADIEKKDAALVACMEALRRPTGINVTMAIAQVEGALK